MVTPVQGRTISWAKFSKISSKNSYTFDNEVKQLATLYTWAYAYNITNIQYVVHVLSIMYY